ncbi:MAG: cytidylate kinase family protein [Candidatus Nanohaloarchaea archaeon]|nr:cytidylate kinase family protein [Candidatus Nanohaloarchaea archaeon]
MTVIVVTGPPGSGSSTVGKLVADKLGLDYFSPGKYLKEKVDGINESESAVKGWREGKMADEDINRSIDDLQKQVAGQGNVVIEGKLSIYMVEDKADLTVWLNAPLSDRAERTAERDDISVEEAKEHIKERQHEEVKNWREMYDFNYLTQEKEADYVIDTSDITAEEVAEKIVSKIER